MAASDPKPPLVNVGNLHTILAVGCEYTMEAGEVDARLGYQGGQPGDKIPRFKQDVGDAIAVGCFERVAHLSVPGQ